MHCLCKSSEKFLLILVLGWESVVRVAYHFDSVDKLTVADASNSYIQFLDACSASHSQLNPPLLRRLCYSSSALYFLCVLLVCIFSISTQLIG